jgi:hypothetical protein
VSLPADKPRGPALSSRTVEPRSTKPRAAPQRMSPARIDPQPGQMIGGRYTVVRLIARGGVGLVYLARQSVSNVAVVVKVLAANLIGDSETSARFDREAQRLRGMQHPNIVEMVDYGQANGSAYLVMEYLQGELLSAYAARKGPLPLADFVPIAAQILKAVGYAHDRGLMHRDLKPTNIMLCVRQGRGNFVKILDFGMAKLIEGERDITSEQIVGTANYLSPEQIRGEALDARVDVYAIGITFYALLAGRLPFNADNNAALLYKHVHEPPPPLADVLPADHDVPSGLIALVHRCLAKSVDERQANANEVVRELVACVPAEMFHLPVAEGGMASASSSYAVLPEGVDVGPEDLSERLTRPVQSLRAVQEGDAEASTARRPIAPVASASAGAAPKASAGNRGRPRLRAPIVAPRPVVTAPRASPLLVSPPEEGGKLWIGVAVVVLLGLLGLAGYLLNRGANAPPEKPVEQIDERRLVAALDQVELDIDRSNLIRARTGLAEVDPRIPAGSGLRTRADAARRRLDIAEALQDAQRLETAADRVGAQSRYRDVLTLDPNHAGARAAIERLSGAAPVSQVRTKPPRPSVGPDGDGAAKPPVEAKAIDRTVDEIVEVASPDADKLIPEAKKTEKKADGPVFLPTDK